MYYIISVVYTNIKILSKNMASTVCPLTRVTGPSVTLSPAISQPIERTPQCDNQCCRVTQCDAT